MHNSIPCGKYQHYKGNFYQVQGIAIHSETEEKMVVYRPLYGAQDLWVRPLTMFTENVEIDGVIRARFVLVD
ncbi:DUF1653 domain-containing protein [Psychromonas sp. CNPT3]|uniref:DUF1653 domain-containing protein n=1 Tax=Psychromonas sp. CNPT3 TaxID=314282 RepID=UPI000326AA12|nr:DUF1653 domain-containing protein [Psychromonas sp. CNPT3]